MLRFQNIICRFIFDLFLSDEDESAAGVAEWWRLPCSGLVPVPHAGADAEGRVEPWQDAIREAGGRGQFSFWPGNAIRVIPKCFDPAVDDFLSLPITDLMFACRTWSSSMRRLKTWSNSLVKTIVWLQSSETLCSNSKHKPVPMWAPILAPDCRDVERLRRWEMAQTEYRLALHAYSVSSLLGAVWSRFSVVPRSLPQLW